jgi:hypothetical protein
VVAPVSRADAIDNAVRLTTRNFEFDAAKKAGFRTLMERKKEESRPIEAGGGE